MEPEGALGATRGGAKLEVVVVRQQPEGLEGAPPDEVEVVACAADALLDQGIVDGLVDVADAHFLGKRVAELVNAKADHHGRGLLAVVRGGQDARVQLQDNDCGGGVAFHPRSSEERADAIATAVRHLVLLVGGREARCKGGWRAAAERYHETLAIVDGHGRYGSPEHLYHLLHVESPCGAGTNIKGVSLLLKLTT